jgi:hypothetical protein
VIAAVLGGLRLGEGGEGGDAEGDGETDGELESTGVTSSSANAAAAGRSVVVAVRIAGAAFLAAFFTSVTSDALAATARRALTGALARTVRAEVEASANIVSGGGACVCVAPRADSARGVDARRGRHAPEGPARSHDSLRSG